MEKENVTLRVVSISPKIQQLHDQMIENNAPFKQFYFMAPNHNYQSRTATAEMDRCSRSSGNNSDSNVMVKDIIKIFNLRQSNQNEDFKQVTDLNLKDFEVKNQNEVSIDNTKEKNILFGMLRDINIAAKRSSDNEVGDKQDFILKELLILAEIKINRLLSNLIEFYGYTIINGKIYMLMEKMDQSFSEYLNHSFKINMGCGTSWAPVFDVLGGVINGLCDLNRLGYYHNDLKPDNVMLGKLSSGEISNIKIIDMGISVKMTSFTAKPCIMGTFDFIDPIYLIYPYHSYKTLLTNLRHDVSLLKETLIELNEIANEFGSDTDAGSDMNLCEQVHLFLKKYIDKDRFVFPYDQFLDSFDKLRVELKKMYAIGNNEYYLPLLQQIKSIIQNYSLDHSIVLNYIDKFIMHDIMGINIFYGLSEIDSATTASIISAISDIPTSAHMLEGGDLDKNGENNENSENGKNSENCKNSENGDIGDIGDIGDNINNPNRRRNNKRNTNTAKLAPSPTFTLASVDIDKIIKNLNPHFLFAVQIFIEIKRKQLEKYYLLCFDTYKIKKMYVFPELVLLDFRTEYYQNIYIILEELVKGMNDLDVDKVEILRLIYNDRLVSNIKIIKTVLEQFNNNKTIFETFAYKVYEKLAHTTDIMLSTPTNYPFENYDTHLAINPDAYSFGIILWLCLYSRQIKPNKKNFKYTSLVTNFIPYNQRTESLPIIYQLAELAVTDPSEYVALFMKSINEIQNLDPLLNNLLVMTLIGCPQLDVTNSIDNIDKRLEPFLNGEILLDESYTYNFYHKLSFNSIKNMWDKTKS